MKQPIRILQLEDDPADRELTRANLDSAGLKYHITDVQTGAEYDNALRQGRYDVILADFRLPMYDGMSALRLAQDLCSDVPFIFVSGTMGEDAAIEGLTQGATDYVLKQKLSRLAPAVTRALNEAKNLRQRREAEKALIASEKKYMDLYDRAPDMYMSVNAKTTLIEECNQTLADTLRRPKKEIIGRSVFEIYHPDCLDDSKAVFQEFLKQGKIRDKELQLRNIDESKLDVSLNMSAVCSSDGSILYSRSTLRDITDRKQAERERLANLKFFESLDRVNRIIQGANDFNKLMKDLLDVVISIFDCDRAFLLYPCDPDSPMWTCPMERNKPEYPSVLDLTHEMPMDNQVAETFRILLAAEGPVIFGPDTKNALPEEVTKKFDIKSFMAMAVYPKTGSPWEFGIHQCSYTRHWTEQEMRLFEEIGRRLTDSMSSMQAYQDLSNNEAFLNNIFEHIPNMVFVKEAETLRFLRFNKAGESLIGYTREELIGKTDYDFFPKDEADFFAAKDRQVLASRELLDISEETIQNRNNEKRILHTKKIPILDVTGAPQYLLGISEDITERRKLEEQLCQSQKMEAIGQLAGGVAHDLNNMLGVVIGYTDLALNRKIDDDALRDYFGTIQMAARRSTEITQQLLAFARKQVAKPKILDLNKTVEEMLKLLRRLIGEDIDLSWLPGPDLWPVKMDPTQIDQILANLCVNARDALAGVGKITIETQNIDLTGVNSAEQKGFPPGEYVLLTISDNGHGMDKQTVNKIFEPFFTTKSKGKGTGLGLSTVFGIVTQNDGFINVYSEPGHGSTFKIYLPRHTVKGQQMLEKSSVAVTVQGSETILLVEDDAMVLIMIKEMLNQFGYAVLTASTPGNAIRIAEERSGRIDLLITDVIMPEMTGRELEQKLRTLCPGIKCLYMSGYTGDVIAHHGVLDEGINFIQKPFSNQEFAVKLREVLEGKV